MTLEEMIPLVAGALNALKLPYLTVGGVAVSIWGKTRTTHDLDIVAKLDPTSLQDLLVHLRRIGFKAARLEERKIREGRWVQLRIGSTRLDLRRLSTPHDETALRRVAAADFPTFRLWVASPEDLILYKLEAWRTQDQADIENLVTHVKDLDRQYVTKQIPVVEEATGLPINERWKEIQSRLA